MSWKDAKITASEWVVGLDLPEDLSGRTLNLRDLAANLPQQGIYREMVLRAAARILRHRGAKLEQS